jgi:ribonucleotide monophosphatase NagD (HAD superfamily)
MGTILVMTGVIGEADVAAAAAAEPGWRRPDYVMRSFGDLLQVRD